MKAVVLAAGTGERFRPLTETRPKSMLPVANKPLLEHVVDSLVEAGIEDLVFVVGHKRERIQNYFKNGNQWGAEITYAVQKTPLGTGDALLQAAPHVDEEFILLNGDRIVESTLVEQLIERRRATGETCMAIAHADDPTQYGMVTIDDDHVSNLIEKPPAHAVTSTLVNAGAYACGLELFPVLQKAEYRGELDLPQTLADNLDEHPVRPVHYDGLWLELSRPWDLLTANEGMLTHTGSFHSRTARIRDEATVVDPVAIGENTSVQPGARILPGTVLGNNVTVGANAVIRNTVVLSDATIGPGTVLTDCIVGENATLGPNGTVEGGRANVVVDDTLYTDVTFGGLLGDNAHVGGATVVEPGTILGNHCAVESGSTISGTIPSKTRIHHS